MVPIGFGDSVFVALLVANLALAVASGFLASQKGRSVSGWCTLAIFVPTVCFFFAMLFLGPAVAIALTAFLGTLIFFTVALSTPLPQ